MSAPISFRGGPSFEQGQSVHGDAVLSLAAGRVHEIHCACADRAAALSFALTMGKWDKDGQLFILRTGRRGKAPLVLFGEGLAPFGLKPERLTVVDAASEVDMLRACLDVVRSGAVAAALMESEGRFSDFDLTASRRLVLAAEASGSCVMLLRVDAQPQSSAAQTRWSVASAPSLPLEAQAPGHPAIHVELLRNRGGPAGARWRLIWDEEHGGYRDAERREAMPGAVVSFPALRTGALDDQRRSA